MQVFTVHVAKFVSQRSMEQLENFYEGKENKYMYMYQFARVTLFYVISGFDVMYYIDNYSIVGKVLKK